MKFKTAVVIGRFQPFHLGHQELIESALALAERVVVVVGSACAARSLRNPFTADERIEMMKLNLPEPDRVRYVRVRDYFYNDSGWINEVREKVREEAGSGTTAIVGHDKDSTSGYLKWFPEWERVELAGKKTGATNVTTTCHGTEIRESYLRDEKSTSIRTELSIATKSWLMEFASRDEYRNLRDEQLAIDSYKRSWSSAPFPPVFVTTDVLIVCAGHLLMIQRKRAPGKGLWALPGGFLDPNEKLETCALRELEEETQLGVPQEELKASLEKVRVFDHPLRSSRGRTITHAHLFRLKRTSLPSFKASDDAAAAKWVPLLDLGKMESALFEDHFHIIHALL